MSIMRKVGSAAAALVLAGAGLLVVGASPAQAAPTMDFSPKGPFKGGEEVTVTFSGYNPNAPVAVGVCPEGRNVEGPGDCAPSKTGASRLVTADASGKGTGKIKIPIGPLQNVKAPAENCGPAKGDGCTMGASAIDGSGEAPVIKIQYVSASTSSGSSSKSSASTSSSSSSKSSSSSSSSSTTSSGSSSSSSAQSPSTSSSTTASSGTESGTLPKTGPRETLAVALVGFVALQIGLIVWVRALRSRPRYLAG